MKRTSILKRWSLLIVMMASPALFVHSVMAVPVQQQDLVFKLYGDGIALRDQGKWQQAIDVFKKLQKDYPDSYRADDAQFQIAYCLQRIDGKN